MQTALDARLLPRAPSDLPQGLGLLPRGAALEPRELIDWARYVALHEAVRLPLIGGHRLTSLVARAAARRSVPERNRALETAVRQRYWALLERDFDNARRGVYPRALLFDVPFATYAGNMPRFLLDAPRILARIGARNHRDLPAHVDLSTYPAYYRRTFHWQTDGYFSQHSAKLYDLGVELLFVGMADVMRRQALAEVVRRKVGGQVRLLDVGAGTGRFLSQAASTLPGSKLWGVDLSPWYVSYARDLLDGDRLESPNPPQVDVANAESLPFADNSFEVVTSIFVMHELPRRVRRNVLAEMRRVLVPGGLLVLEDAAQASDSRELTPALEQFSKDMHEPYFDDYQADDLGALLSERGFEDIATSAHFVAKVVSGTKALARVPGGLVY
jgi:ubiquinone/menaquinone biosynthesis C-methylase UbiE